MVRGHGGGPGCGAGSAGFRGCSVKIVDFGQIVGSWTWGGGPGCGAGVRVVRGFRGCSVTIMVKWTNSGFVDMGGGARGVGRGSAGVPWTFRHFNGQMDK